MNSSPRRRVWLLGGGATLLLAFLGMLSARRPAARVAVVRAVRENVSALITTNGKAEPITPYPIRAQLATFVDKIFVVEGQAVKRGQVLLTLDADQARAELALARERLVAAQDDLRAARAGGRADDAAKLESDLRKAEVERARLRSERQALERLVAKQAATKDELDQNGTQLARAEADGERLRKTKEEFDRRTRLEAERARLLVERYQNEVRALEEKVRSAQVTAPVDGTLYSLPVLARGPHDYVKVGDLMAEVADLRHVRVRAFIDEPELGSLEPNQVVEITWDALPAKSWYGHTEQVPKQVVARGTRSVGELLCSVENPRLELLPNINVNVRIHVRELRNALVVPRGAVHIEGKHHFVFIVGSGRLGVEDRLQKREIQVGIASATKYEVLGGLREGETVALPGDGELRDHMRVRVVEPQ